jgi:translocation and assembly module TamB
VRVLGYLVLLILTLYFIFVKPYLMLKRVEWDVEGLELSFRKGLSFKGFLLLIPLRELTLSLYVKGASLKPWEFSVEELSLVEVSQRPPTDKPFDYDFSPLVRLAGRLNLKTESIYVSSNYVPYEESLTLFIRGAELRGGVLSSKDWAEVYWIKGADVRPLRVYLERAHVEGSNFVVDRALVDGGHYRLELSGRWEGKRGSFKGKALIGPFQGKDYHLDTIRLSFGGSISYTRINTDFTGESPYLEMKDRKSFRDIEIKGTYLWKWRGEHFVKSHLQSGMTVATLDYSLRDKSLRMDFKNLEVDSRLLRTDRKVYGLASGRLSLELKKKELSLEAFLDPMQFMEHSLRMVNLRLSLSYLRGLMGSFELSSYHPFQLFVKGSYAGGLLSGHAVLSGYPLRAREVSSELSYMGRFTFTDGTLSLEGGGKLHNLGYRDVMLGDSSYSIRVDRLNKYSLNIAGQGFNLLGEGSLEYKTFKGNLHLSGFNLSYGGFDLRGVGGMLWIDASPERLTLLGSIDGQVLKGGISSHFSSELRTTLKEKEWEGSFEGKLRDLRAFNQLFERGSFKGSLEKEKLGLSVDLDDRLTLAGYYDLREKLYVFEGSLKETYKDLVLSTSYSIRGKGDKTSVQFSGRGTYKKLSFPVDGSLSITGRKLEGYLKGFSLREGIVRISLDGGTVEGTLDEGRIRVLPILLYVGDREEMRLDLKEGSFNLKERSLYLKEGKVSGLAEGVVALSFQEKIGLTVNSNGTLDLSRLFSLVRSRMLADGEGSLKYTLSYRGGKVNLSAQSQDLYLRSRYIAFPMTGSLNLRLDGNYIAGKLSLRGNNRASFNAVLTGNLKEAKATVDGSEIPILYRKENMRANLLLSGAVEAFSDYRSLNLRGKVQVWGVANLQKLPKAEGGKSEIFKRVGVDLVIDSREPIRLNIPEGFIYTDLWARIRGNLYDPQYSLLATLKGGNLTYYERQFYIRRGSISVSNKESNLDLTLIAPAPDYSIIIDLKGNPQFPKALVRSEPPRDTREVLSTLVLGGGTGEGLLSLSGALVSAVPEISNVVRGAQRAAGLDLKFQASPSLAPTGEAGVNVKVSKEVTERLELEHQLSTSRNPRDTYTGGELKLTPNTSLGGRVYSDRSQEIRVRLRRKFDF